MKYMYCTVKWNGTYFFIDGHIPNSFHFINATTFAKTFTRTHYRGNYLIN